MHVGSRQAAPLVDGLAAQARKAGDIGGDRVGTHGLRKRRRVVRDALTPEVPLHASYALAVPESGGLAWRCGAEMREPAVLFSCVPAVFHRQTGTRSPPAEGHREGPTRSGESKGSGSRRGAKAEHSIRISSSREWRAKNHSLLGTRFLVRRAAGVVVRCMTPTGWVRPMDGSRRRDCSAAPADIV
jgi:hypothetical protein